jgi:hypothetical protein
MEGFEDMITVERMIQGRHMDYLRKRRLGRPIGSGAVESLCAQLQNRFKRCGQFWSAAGLEAFLKAYVWYVNGELHHCYGQAVAA